MIKKFVCFLSILFCISAFTGCVKQDANTVSSKETFNILAGSELKDVMPEVEKFAASKGKTLKVTYSGSLDAVDTLLSEHSFDAVWLSHSKYLRLVPGVNSQIAESEKIMYSQVVLGVRPEKAKLLGWNSQSVISWKDILASIKRGDLSLAMTNPAGSNTGFVTLVGIASAFSGKADALTVEDIPHDLLKQFFSGVSLSSGSSGDLVSKFSKSTVDSMINYESIVKTAPGNLVIIKPSEGVVTADYPFILLKRSAEKQTYTDIVSFLKSAEFQKNSVVKSGRSPLNHQVESDVVVNELPFPGSLSVVDTLLAGYLNEYSKPSLNYFVLDTSGSMAGERIDNLKQSILNLATGDGSVGGRFSMFKNREIVKLARFTHESYPVKKFELTSNKTQNTQVLQELRQEVQGYMGDGGTAIYSAIANIYKEAQIEAKAGNRRVSIVVMTDGENKDGLSLGALVQLIIQSGNPRIPIYGIMYGEADPEDMTTLVKATDGVLFDARKTPLQKVFKQIRAYQ